MNALFYESSDARVWAGEFIEHVTANPQIATDEGAMIAWFSNAIMRGWDDHARKYPAEALIRAVITFDTTSQASGHRPGARDAVVAEALALARPHIDHDCLEMRGAREVTR